MRQQYAVCLSLELRLTTMATNVIEAAQRLQRAVQDLIAPQPIADVSCTTVEAQAGFVSQDVCPSSGKTPILDYVRLCLDKTTPVAAAREHDVDLIPMIKTIKDWRKVRVTCARNESGMSAAIDRSHFMALHDCGHWMLARRLWPQQ